MAKQSAGRGGRSEAAEQSGRVEFESGDAGATLSLNRHNPGQVCPGTRTYIRQDYFFNSPRNALSTAASRGPRCRSEEHMSELQSL